MIRAGADELRPFLESRRGEFDAVLVCRPHNMQSFLDAVGADRERLLAGAKLIYDAEAVFAGRAILEAGTGGKAVPEDEARTLVAQEIALTYASDEVLSVSAAELQVFQRHGGQVRPPARPRAGGGADRSAVRGAGRVRLLRGRA
jgi:hypothetical protein